MTLLSFSLTNAVNAVTTTTKTVTTTTHAKKLQLPYYYYYYYQKYKHENNKIKNLFTSIVCRTSKNILPHIPGLGSCSSV